jgi:hypothetical protein
MIINLLINEFLIISNIFMYFYSNETLSAIFSIQCIKRYVPLLFTNSYGVFVFSLNSLNVKNRTKIKAN